MNGTPCITDSLNLDPEEDNERIKLNREAAIRYRLRRLRRSEAAAADARLHQAVPGATEPTDEAEPMDESDESSQTPWPPIADALRNAKPGEMIELALAPL